MTYDIATWKTKIAERLQQTGDKVRYGGAGTLYWFLAGGEIHTYTYRLSTRQNAACWSSTSTHNAKG